MLPISRSDNSIFLNKFIEKKAHSILERISFGVKKEDPFEKLATNDVWFISNNILLRNKKAAIKKKK